MRRGDGQSFDILVEFDKQNYPMGMGRKKISDHRDVTYI